MISLIKKDLKVALSKLNTTFIAFFTIFALFIFGEKNPQGTYAYILMTIVLTLSSSSFAFDEKNNSDVLLNSLPITRSDVVIAKYITLLLYILIALVFSIGMFVLTNTIGFTSVEIFQINMNIKVVLLVLVMNSIMIPFFFRLGFRKSKILRIIVFMIFFIGINSFIFNNNLEHGELTNSILAVISGTGMIYLQVTLTIIIAFVSLGISLRLYEQKDL